MLMKILVPIKRVVDYRVSVRVKQDHSAVETANVKMSPNPFDEIAVEAAVRLKEQGLANEIIAVSIGEENCQDVLRAALSMGVDRAILIKTTNALQPLAIAKILKQLVLQENITLVIAGKQAIDTDDNQVGQMLAGLLNWPQGTFASQCRFHDNGVSVTREIDGGLETLFLTLPAVITTDLRLNEPRYPSLINIAQAKRKPLAVVDVSTITAEVQPRFTSLSVDVPKQARACMRLETVAELAAQLKKALL